jgi:hypothetical protein
MRGSEAQRAWERAAILRWQNSSRARLTPRRRRDRGQTPRHADRTTPGGRRVMKVGRRLARSCMSQARPRSHCWCGRRAQLTAHRDPALPLPVRERQWATQCRVTRTPSVVHECSREGPRSRFGRPAAATNQATEAPAASGSSRRRSRAADVTVLRWKGPRFRSGQGHRQLPQPDKGSHERRGAAWPLLRRQRDHRPVVGPKTKGIVRQGTVGNCRQPCALAMVALSDPA